MNRKVIASGAIVVGLTVSVWGKGFWDKPYNQWSKDQVFKMLNDSPWAKQTTFAWQTGDERSGVTGEKELYFSYTVRPFTALPIRHAYVRLMQLMNNYDNASPEQKQQMDQRFSRPLQMDVSREIIIAVEFGTNVAQDRMGQEREVKQWTAEQLKQRVYLISARLGRIPIQQYFPPALDGTGMKMFFPREVEGKPVIAPEDKEIGFEFWSNQGKVFITWKVRDLMYQGQLAF